MEPPLPSHVIEPFHLLFLAHLTRGADKRSTVFKSQVLSFLPPEEQSRYDSADAWETMVLEVLEALDGAAT